MNKEDSLKALRSLLEPCFSRFGSLVYLTLWRASEGKPGAYGSCTTIKFEGQKERTVDYWQNLDEETDVKDPFWGVNTTALLLLLEISKEQEEDYRHWGDVVIHRNIEECRYVGSRD